MDDRSKNTPERREINLQQLATDFMAGMQRHFDMLAFNLAAREAVTEEDYKRISQAPHLLPSFRQHQNFEQTQAYARDLMMRQLLNDALGLVFNLLNNTHFFLTLVKCSNGKSELDPDQKKEAEALQKSFVESPLDEKFNRLEKDYSIRCELEDTVTSIGLSLQSLVQNSGKVCANHLDENKELVLELKSAMGNASQSPDKVMQVSLEAYCKVFREGDYVSFNDKELQLTLVTIASFADGLFNSIARYVKETRGS
ncbi:MAG: hypothetical protein GWO81_03445 [Verrucomicrobia bacterium]|nr:hypothetical protein [Verrucomicrobiota bacterium]